MASHNMIVRQDQPVRIPDDAGTRAKPAAVHYHQGGQHLPDKLVDYLCKRAIEIHRIHCLIIENIRMPLSFSLADHNIHSLGPAAAQDFDWGGLAHNISV